MPPLPPSDSGSSSRPFSSANPSRYFESSRSRSVSASAEAKSQVNPKKRNIMHFDLIKIFNEMDWMARGVTFVLLLMGVASLAVVIERLVAFARSAQQSADFTSQVGPLIADRNYDKLLSEAEKRKNSFLTRMLAPALKIYLTHEWQAMDNAAAVIELVRRELARKQEEATSDIRRG